MKLENLKEIGLTSSEIKVYDALLDLGECTKTNLVVKSQVSQSKIYDITSRLINKGIVTSVRKKNILHFKATNPNRLKDFIIEKEKEILREKTLVNQMLPSLLTKYENTQEEVDIDVYQGWDGLKTAFLLLENSMDKTDCSYVFGASIGKDPDAGDRFWRQHQQRVEEKGFKVKIIFNEDIKEKRIIRSNYYDKHKLHEIKYKYEKTMNEFYIYKEYVLIIISLKKPIGILIKNKETVDSFKTFFESMWETSK